MENASKALMMAGAILITLLLISLTMYAFQIVTNYTEDSQIQSYNTQAEAFNRFFIYSSNDIDSSESGIQIKGSDAYNLIAKVFDLNQNEWSLHEVTIVYDGEALDTETLSTRPDKNSFLEIVIEDDEEKRYDSKKLTYSYSFDSNTGYIDRIVLDPE